MLYKPFGENLFYPYVALQDLPGNKCTKQYYYDNNVVLDKCFGFYYCEINAP